MAEVLTREAGRAGTRYYVIFPLLIAAMLFVYKTNSALKVLRSTWSSGTIAGRPTVVEFGRNVSAVGALERTLHYFDVIWPALAFGIFIAAAVRAFVSPRWFARFVAARSMGAQLTAGLAGAPLMLCSCCVAPVFTSVLECSERLGPALGLMLASPSLNPAALALTLMLFEPSIAVARIAAALAAVILIGPVAERIMGPRIVPARSKAATENDPAPGNAAKAFLKSLGTVAIRTLPGIILGVAGSMLLVQWLPPQTLSIPHAKVVSVFVTATIAVPLALPTFLEIPLSLSLIAAGLPPGAAVALLFAGPAINLPSLLSVGRMSGWRTAALVAATVWVLAILAGLLVN